MITAALAERDCTVVGMDASEPYLEGARRNRPHPNIVYELGDARRMSYADASFDACVSALTVDVIPEVDQVVREMRRVTRPGGVVASGVFDFWGGFSAADLVLDTASVLDEGMSSLRDQRKARLLVWANGQAEIWRSTGFVDVVEVPMVTSFDYTSFEDYWSSFSTGPGLRRGITGGGPRRGGAARSRRLSGRAARRSTVVCDHIPRGAGYRSALSRAIWEPPRR